MTYFIYIVGRLFPAGIGLCTVIVLSNIAEPSTYGDYAVFLAFAMILNLVFFQWNRSSVTRHAAHDPVNIGEVIGSSISIHLMNALFVSLAAFFASFVFGVSAFQILIMTLVCSTSDFFLELARATGRAKQYSFNYALRQCLFLILSLIMLNNSNEEYLYFGNAIIASYVLAFFISTFPFAVFFLRLFRANLSIVQLKIHFKFGLPLVLNFSLTGFVNQIDKIIVDNALGREIAGVYSLAVDVTKQVLLTLMEAVNLASFPSLVKVYERCDFTKAREKMQQNLNILLGLSIPATVGFMILIPDVSHLFIGGEFLREFLQIAPIIALASLARGTRVYYFDQAFHLSRETMKPAINTAAALVVFLILSLISVEVYGTTGVASSVLASSVISCVFSFGLGRGAVQMPFSLRSFCICVVCSIFMAAVVHYVSMFVDHTIFSALVMIVSGAVSYFLSCLMFNYGGLRSFIVLKLQR